MAGTGDEKMTNYSVSGPFICGVNGEEKHKNIHTTITICPEYGSDAIYVYRLAEEFKCPSGLTCSGDGLDCVGEGLCEEPEEVNLENNILYRTYDSAIGRIECKIEFKTGDIFFGNEVGAIKWVDVEKQRQALELVCEHLRQQTPGHSYADVLEHAFSGLLRVKEKS